jgi:hypothetical protein
MGALSGRVAIVTGASRGGGRGIANVLGEAGATFYVTGRSVRRNMTKPELTGTTIDDTAESVTARGGKGIPLRVDHRVDEEAVWVSCLPAFLSGSGYRLLFHLFKQGYPPSLYTEAGRAIFNSITPLRSGFLHVMPLDFSPVFAGISSTPVLFCAARRGTLTAIGSPAVFIALRSRSVLGGHGCALVLPGSTARTF